MVASQMCSVWLPIGLKLVITSAMRLAAGVVLSDMWNTVVRTSLAVLCSDRYESRPMDSGGHWAGIDAKPNGAEDRAAIMVGQCTTAHVV